MSQRTYLDRAAILAVPDITTEDVEVPEWGTWLRVRGITARERDEWEASCLTGKGKNREVSIRNLRAKLVVLSVVDEQDRRIFRDADVVALGDKSSAAVDRIYDVASRLAGVTDSDVEELTKNSESDQSDDSISD